MNTKTNQDQEVDLNQIFNKIENLFEGFISKIFDGILFLKRNIIILLTLIILGAVAGYFLDKNSKVYDNEVIVSPNFGSVDYLYKKIELLESKIKEGDDKFLSSINVKNPESILKIEIEPVLDIYTFVNSNTTIANNAQNTQNFELVKLLSEESDINKVIKDELTSKNYSHHSIKIVSGSKISNETVIKPLIEYLNNSTYYKDLQKIYLNNVNNRIVQDQIIIGQIDGLLNQFSSTTNGPKNDKLVYYNENTQLNDIIKNKTDLIAGLGYQRQLLLDFDQVVKTKTVILNIVDYKGINGKLKLIIPLLLISLFIGFKILYNLYKHQMLKRKNSL